MKTCPRCSLLNPDDGVVCACGFDLVNGDVAAAQGVRRGVRRRGALYQVAGIGLIIFGLAGGTVYLPMHLSLFLSFGSYTVDLGLVIVGAVLLARGARLSKEPWTEKVDGRRPD
jgi:hypothetical protein